MTFGETVATFALSGDTFTVTALVGRMRNRTVIVSGARTSTVCLLLLDGMTLKPGARA